MTCINAQLSYNINFPDEIECFNLSEYEWSQNLICIAINKKIIIGLIKYKPDEEVEFELQNLKELHHEKRCNAIAIAPQSSLTLLPNIVDFCVADSDYNLMVYHSNLENDNTVQLLSGHTNYINAIAWEPEGDYLASVSDDHSCIIYSRQDDEYEKKTTFYLTSAGVSIKWHPDKEDKILVAEKNGLIRFYNVKTEQAILSLESKKSPLMCIDWSINNNSMVAAISCGELIIWNLNKPSIPIENKQIYENGGMIVKFSSINEHLIATIGQPNMTLKILCLKTNKFLIEQPLKLCCGIAWHFTQQFLIAGNDRKLKFWTIS